MSEPLRTWLRSRKKIRTFELIREHSAKALQVADEFLTGVNAALEGRRDETKAAFKRESLREREGDALRRKVMVELAKGELLPEERDYLMRLARRIDAVADYAHGASRILSFLPLENADESLKREVRTMASKVRQCVASMDDCVRKLIDGDLDGASAAAEAVDDLEEEVDELHMSTRRILMDEYYARADPRIIVFSSEFLEAVEDTSDRCEDVSDQVSVLLIYLSQPSA